MAENELQRLFFSLSAGRRDRKSGDRRGRDGSRCTYHVRACG